MKTYDQILQKINESEYGDGGGFGIGDPGDSHGRSAYSDAGIYRTESPAQMKRVNAFIKAFTQKEFLDPRAALGMLRAKLNITGLDFPLDKKVELNTENTSFKLTRFGGTFGKAVDTPFDKFDETNGFADGKAFALNVKLTDGPNGLYKIEANITEVSDSASFDVSDENAEKDSKVLHPGKSEKKEKDTLESFIQHKK
tara:strand:+ start:729 stop:1322 length:594 start_codon:yes stop_codon:yes gene_type:complete